MSDRAARRFGVWLRPKTAVFGCIALMTLYVLYHNERFLIEPENPEWRHIERFKWWLLPHAIAGACALVLAPLQFSDRLRRRHTTLHHVVGRIYVGGALLLAPLGVYIQYFQESIGGTRSFSVLSAVDAGMLMTTTGVAFLFALRRRINAHRQWMTRSYAVALVFFEGRFVTGLTGWEASDTATQTTIWSCLALSLLLAELANQWPELRSAVSATPVRAQARSSDEPVYALSQPIA
jgi:uncharacterized membrane protein